MNRATRKLMPQGAERPIPAGTRMPVTGDLIK
jgi:hypothetical protein